MISEDEFVYLFTNDIIRLKYEYTYTNRYYIFKYINDRVLYDEYSGDDDILVLSDHPSYDEVWELYTFLVEGMVSLSIIPNDKYKSRRCV